MPLNCFAMITSPIEIFPSALEKSTSAVFQHKTRIFFTEPVKPASNDKKCCVKSPKFKEAVDTVVVN